MSDTAETPVKPPRKKRGASKFIVLKRAPSDSADFYSNVAEGTTIDACRKAIIDGKIEGDLMIVCVRFRLISTKRETVDIKITS